MKNSLMNYIYIYISRALILLLALFTVFSTVGAFKINANDTSTITIIKETDDGTDKEFKFRIKASKTTETTLYEYFNIMAIASEGGESSWRYFHISEDMQILNYSLFKGNSYIYCVLTDSFTSQSWHYDWGYWDFMCRRIDRINDTLHLFIEEDEFNDFIAAYHYVLDSLTFDYYEPELTPNEDGYYESKATIKYKGESYVLYSENLHRYYGHSQTLYDTNYNDEIYEEFYIRVPKEVKTVTEYLDLSSDSRFTSIGDNVYEFTVKANDSTGVKIDIPVGYTYEIEEVEDSDYTLKSINNDDVFDVTGEMGTGAETFTFFNESKDEPIPVEPTPRVDKPKYNLPKTGIE